MTSPAGTVWLSFRNAGDLPGVDEPLVHDLSAVATLGRSLFCASDETASVERLIHDPASGGYGDHRHVRLDSFFDLPEPGGEMDIEGMAVADGHLWITGSQGLKRKKLTGSADLFQAGDIEVLARQITRILEQVADADPSVGALDLGTSPQGDAPAITPLSIDLNF